MKVQVYNVNNHPYKEHFKGVDVEIPPMGFVEMELDDAILFKGTMNRVLRDADGNPLPESYKMIRIVKDEKTRKAIEATRTREMKITCQACGFRGVNEKDLEIHVMDEHPELLKTSKEELKKYAPKKAS